MDGNDGKRRKVEWSDDIGFTEEDMLVAVKVGQALNNGFDTKYHLPSLQPLRRAWGPLLYSQGKLLVEKEAKMTDEKLLNSKIHRQKDLDRKMIETRKLRQSRMLQLNALKETQGEHLCLIPDGAVDDGFNTNVGQSGGTENVVQVLQDDKPSASPKDHELHRPRSCYQCKSRFSLLHHFYDQLCPKCAGLNWTKRLQKADMKGALVLLTGGRVKIGYQIGLKLLRMGARVIVTTRFPADAALRYSKESDAPNWSSNLQVYNLDFRDIVATEAFTEFLNKKLDRLDAIINNACQTIRRPDAYYKHLIETETKFKENVNHRARKLLGDSLPKSSRFVSSIIPDAEKVDDSLFPKGAFDVNAQQIDMRTTNSWLLTLSKVSTNEVVEVMAVNTIAPLILNARLKDLMVGSKSDRGKYIINVSAMEGKFYRHKNANHPHTNMAKAALNMMTRTSAQEYVKDGIFMNSVDTGWINDENPLETASRIAVENRFQTPIDEVDAASRVIDPIVTGFNGTEEERVYGLFLKDYRETEW